MNTHSDLAIVPSSPAADLERFGTRAPTSALDVVLFETLINNFAKLGYMHPGANADLYDVDVLRDIPYRDTGLDAHTMDVYLPTTKSGPWPVVLYVHGGGFRLLSKETHWMMAMAFARRGYMVVNINYRLAPEHPFPAAIEDVSAAFLWLVRNAARHGGDLSRLVFAGESAGANLVTSLALQTSYRRPEPWAKEVFETGVTPKAVMAACGIFQVSDAERLLRGSRLPSVVRSWIRSMEDGYLGAAKHADSATTELADPVRVLERGEQPERPLPSFFVPVGGNDPLVDDTYRLDRALRKLGVPVRSRVYEGGGHAFHMLTMRPLAKKLWRDTFDFLDVRLPSTKRAVFGPTRAKSGNWLQDRIIDAMAA